MDFVFDRTAEGRSIKSLTEVDDATHEAVTIVPERALGGRDLAEVIIAGYCVRDTSCGNRFRFRINQFNLKPICSITADNLLSRGRGWNGFHVHPESLALKINQISPLIKYL
jgi:hypothetical protein